MRRATRAAVVVALLFLSLPAFAENFAACWVTSAFDPVVGDYTQVTRCRISGGAVIDYASDDSVPSPLSPTSGTDLTGECWYLTSTDTNWIFLDRYLNGDAVLGYQPDPNGGVAVATERIPRCTSEPGALDPSVEAWRYVTEYIHPPPAPDVSPEPGNGVTGLETFVGVPIPAIHETQIGSATGVTLDIYIEVTAVEVDWGDNRVDSFPADETALSGYPDGIATHVYEVKDETGYAMAISYHWTARWRVGGGSWEFLDVPDTTTTLTYPVAEIVSVITD